MAATRRSDHLRCPTAGSDAAGCRCGDGEGRGHHAPALRPRRQLRPVSRRDASTCRTARCTTPPGRYMCARVLRRALTRSRTWSAWCATSTRAACASTTATPSSRPASRCTCIGGHTMGLQVGARRDAARLGGARLRREPLLRQHGAGAAVPDRLSAWPTWWRATAAARAGRFAAHIIPGHDPLVLRALPAPSKALQGIVGAARLAVRASDWGYPNIALPP